MTAPRPRTRWKRLAVVSSALLIVGAYGIIAWGAGSIAWPLHEYKGFQHMRRLRAATMHSVPFDTESGAGYIGLPGTTIWAIVPHGVFGTRLTPASDGIRGLRPAIWWHGSEHRVNVIVTTIDAIRAGPSTSLPADSPYAAWWDNLRETAELIVSDAESSDDPSLAYSLTLDAPEGGRSRLDVDLEFGAAVIISWHEGDTEPPDMWEYFTIGEPVPADGN